MKTKIPAGVIGVIVGVLLFLLVLLGGLLNGQDIITLPIENHTESMSEGFWRNVYATPTNGPMVVMEDSNNVVAFSVTILSRVEFTNTWQGTIIAMSNVLARIVWKGKTNECVLERTQQ